MSSMKISKRRWLLVPVETKARELTAKILLAAVAAERGWGAVVGEKKTVRGKQYQLPRGAFIEKSISPGRMTHIQRAKSFGNRVSAWCEEGLIYISLEEYSQKRLEPQSFNSIDYFFTWGEKQAADISSILGPNKKTVLSGNPRFDLLRPELRNIFAQSANEIRSRFGKFILINTKFSDVNNNRNIPDFDYVSFLRSYGKIRTSELERLMRHWVKFNERVFGYFQKMMPVISKSFSGHTIIIRPHPSESHKPWQELSYGLPNVKVIFEGNVSEWLLAADVMIHNNCTTGVEAFLLGKPAISYRPIQDKLVEHELPNNVSFQAFSEDQLISLVRRFLEKGIRPSREELDSQRAFAGKYIANMEGALASDIIMDTFDKLELPMVEGKFPIKESIARIVINKAKHIKKHGKWRLRNSSETENLHLYYQQKFPGITLEEVKGILKELSNATGRFYHVQITPVDDNTYCFFCP